MGLPCEPPCSAPEKPLVIRKTPQALRMCAIVLGVSRPPARKLHHRRALQGKVHRADVAQLSLGAGAVGRDAGAWARGAARGAARGGSRKPGAGSLILHPKCNSRGGEPAAEIPSAGIWSELAVKICTVRHARAPGPASCTAAPQRRRRTLRRSSEGRSIFADAAQIGVGQGDVMRKRGVQMLTARRTRGPMIGGGRAEVGRRAPPVNQANGWEEEMAGKGGIDASCWIRKAEGQGCRARLHSPDG
jgi:hypothetical protein